MGFKENLKSELVYSGMLVKELSARSGVKKHTIDNYLNTHNAIPSADSAVSIAQVLGVTVEYLITGEDPKEEKPLSSLPAELRTMLDIAEKLSKKNRRLAVTILKAMADQERVDSNP